MRFRIIIINFVLFSLAAHASPAKRELNSFIAQYRQSQISDAQALIFLRDYITKDDMSRLSSEEKSQYFELLGRTFENLGCPFFALHFFKLSLENSAKPFSLENQRLWESIERMDAKAHYVPQLLEMVNRLSENRKESQFTLPTEFLPTWIYLRGLHFSREQKYEDAERFFSQLHTGDRYFLAGQYQWSLNQLQGEPDAAEAALRFKTLLAEELDDAVKTNPLALTTYQDQARLSIARIQFERQNYESAAKYYRQVTHRSRAFFDSLNEQAWAFFMAGYPNHALGALHSATSPRYSGRFNPEAPLLRAMIYYWMCRYSDAKSALGDFLTTYREKLNRFDRWFKPAKISDDSASKLYENFVSGVSSNTLGIDREIIDDASSSGQMIEARQHLSLYLSDFKQLKKAAHYQTHDTRSFLTAELLGIRESINKQLGNALMNELKGLSANYDDLKSQADFLGIELLMSEKEQVQGSELHAKQKLESAEQVLSVKGWGNAELPWKASAKGEYWADELGYYVYQVQSQCVEK